MDREPHADDDTGSAPTVPLRPTTPPPRKMADRIPSADGKYGGYSRFELELEVCPVVAPSQPPFANLTPGQFVQCLANPHYLNHLAQQKIFDKPEFVAYLGYLQYFKDPNFAKYLQYVLLSDRASDD